MQQINILNLEYVKVKTDMLMLTYEKKLSSMLMKMDMVLFLLWAAFNKINVKGHEV